jgi:hypothetical protein
MAWSPRVWDSHYTAAKSAIVQDVANRVKTGVA